MMLVVSPRFRKKNGGVWIRLSLHQDLTRGKFFSEFFALIKSKKKTTHFAPRSKIFLDDACERTENAKLRLKGKKFLRTIVIYYFTIFW